MITCRDKYITNVDDHKISIFMFPYFRIWNIFKIYKNNNSIIENQIEEYFKFLSSILFTNKCYYTFSWQMY